MPGGKESSESNHDKTQTSKATIKKKALYLYMYPSNSSHGEINSFTIIFPDALWRVSVA